MKKESYSLILGNGNIIPKIEKKEDGVLVVFYMAEETIGCGVPLEKPTKTNLLPNMYNGFYFKNKKSIEVVIGWLEQAKKEFDKEENKATV